VCHPVRTRGASRGHRRPSAAVVVRSRAEGHVEGVRRVSAAATRWRDGLQTVLLATLKLVSRWQCVAPALRAGMAPVPEVVPSEMQTAVVWVRSRVVAVARGGRGGVHELCCWHEETGHVRMFGREPGGVCRVEGVCMCVGMRRARRAVFRGRAWHSAGTKTRRELRPE